MTPTVLERSLARSLAAAVRFIEVQQAYQGAMTAAQVEESIRRSQNVAVIQIAANSCNVLASFDIHRAKALIAQGCAT